MPSEVEVKCLVLQVGRSAAAAVGVVLVLTVAAEQKIA